MSVLRASSVETLQRTHELTFVGWFVRGTVDGMVCDGRQSNQPDESVFNNSRFQFSFSRSSEAASAWRIANRPELDPSAWTHASFGSGRDGTGREELNSDRTYDVETISVTKLFLQ